MLQEGVGSLLRGRNTQQMLQVWFSVSGTRAHPLSAPASQALVVRARAESCAALPVGWADTAPHKLCNTELTFLSQGVNWLSVLTHP